MKRLSVGQSYVNERENLMRQPGKILYISAVYQAHSLKIYSIKIISYTEVNKLPTMIDPVRF